MRVSEPDKQTKAQPGPLRKVLTLLLPPVLGAALGYGIAKYAVTAAFLRETFSALSAWDLLLLPVAILAVIAVHEAGHLAGGLARGMRFLLYVVGPFQISRSAQGLRFDWVFNLGTFGGLAACIPRTDQPLRGQLLPMISGGPLASLLLALLGWGLYEASNGRWAAWALIVALLSAMIFLVTAFPMRAGGFMSDGAQFLEVLRGGAAVEARHRLTLLMGQSLAGARPSELDPSLIDACLGAADADPGRRVAARYYALLHACDRADVAQAGEHADWIAEHIEGFPDGFCQALAVELAIFDAQYRNDLVSASAWRKKAKGGIVDPARRALAEALLEPDPKRRAEHLDTARRGLRRSSDAGLSRMTAEQITRVEG